MIICNGVPKSGTHFLGGIIELMGFPRVFDPQPGPYCIVGHYPAHEEIPAHTYHVLIIRNPRNVLVSMVRFSGFPVVPGSLIRGIRNHDILPGTFMKVYNSFVPWLQDSGCIIVRFESLIEDRSSIDDLAFRIGGTSDGVYELAPTLLTMTRTGKLSDWREHWTTKVDEIWKENGGDILEQELGYG